MANEKVLSSVCQFIPIHVRILWQLFQQETRDFDRPVEPFKHTPSEYDGLKLWTAEKSDFKTAAQL